MLIPLPLPHLPELLVEFGLSLLEMLLDWVRCRRGLLKLLGAGADAGGCLRRLLMRLLRSEIGLILTHSERRE
jgi:hypothetical protein